MLVLTYQLCSLGPKRCSPLLEHLHACAGQLPITTWRDFNDYLERQTHIQLMDEVNNIENDAMKANYNRNVHLAKRLQEVRQSLCTSIIRCIAHRLFIQSSRAVLIAPSAEAGCRAANRCQQRVRQHFDVREQLCKRICIGFLGSR